MSNFSFLDSEWPQLLVDASKAEASVNTDPRTSIFYARRMLEQLVDWLYKYDRSIRLPYQDNLSALIHEPTFKAAVGEAVFTKARLIKDLGNLAVHSTRKVAPTDALTAVRELFHISYWLVRTYGKRSRPDPSLRFTPDLIPPAVSVTQKSQEQLQQLEAQLKERDEKLTEILSSKLSVDEELKRLREEVASTKKANEAKPDTHDYSEAETRDYFIDLLLKEAGWDLKPRNIEVEVSGMPNDQRIGFVDYVLWADDGKPLAVIEAKRTKRSPNEGQQQAKLYADCLETQFGQRPVIFYSNGYKHWIWDDQSYPPRKVDGFYKKDELDLLIQRRTSRHDLASLKIKEDIVGRVYQTRAVRRVAETFETHNQRKALLVMATGSGKTRTVIALCDLLQRANWAKRVLFLADRISLVKQASRAFLAHLPDSSPINLLKDRDATGRFYFSTYQTMMGLIDETVTGQRRFGVGHFDLIVIDEAHRSVYQKYRAIFNYFDSLLVGLTATPKDEIDHNTYTLFDLEKGVPTDAYDLDQAVADGYLVPPVAISVPLKFQREGIKYDDLSDEEKEQWDALEWGDDGGTPDSVDAADLNNWLFNIDTVDKVLEQLMTEGQRVAGGDRLGKSIIFAKNNAHADFIADRFNANYPQYKGHFARVVTYKTEYAQDLIDAFSDKEKMPHIAISVDMLDTGIDVPEVVNLVFFKVVRSKTKFWQMLGRGTRLCSDLFGPGEDKVNFNVFDYCQNLEFFIDGGKTKDAPLTESLSARLFKARVEMVTELDQREDRKSDGELTLRNETASGLHKNVVSMNLQNFIVRKQREYVERYAQDESWATLTPEQSDEISRRLAGLPSELSDQDEDAKRFDLLVLRTQLSILKASANYTAYKERVQKVANTLEDQDSIPAIKAEMALIKDLLTEEWWEDVTLPMLENARKRLRALIKLIPKRERPVLYTNFEDERGEGKPVDLPEVKTGVDMAKFKEKARLFLREHQDHISLIRLRRNQSLTPSDLEEFERILADAGGSQEQISKAKEMNHGLGLFIRSLVGLERDAVRDAFAEFIKGTTASADQIEFINLLIDELTRNGVMDSTRLFESPYTDLNAQGPLGIFPPEKAQKIIQIIEQFKDRAVA